MKLRTKILGALTALALAGGGAALALDAQAAPPPALPSAAALAAAGGMTENDVALVKRHASFALPKAATAQAVRAPGASVRALVLAPGEDPGDGGKAFGKTLIVARVDGAVDASLAIPHRRGEKLPAVDAEVVVIDPDDGHMVTTIYLAASDAKGKGRFALASLGATPVAVDVPARAANVQGSRISSLRASLWSTQGLTMDPHAGEYGHGLGVYSI